MAKKFKVSLKQVGAQPKAHLVITNKTGKDCFVHDNILQPANLEVMIKGKNEKLQYYGKIVKAQSQSVLIEKEKSLYKDFTLTEFYELERGKSYTVSFHGSLECCQEKGSSDSEGCELYSEVVSSFDFDF